MFVCVRFKICVRVCVKFVFVCRVRKCSENTCSLHVSCKCVRGSSKVGTVAKVGVAKPAAKDGEGRAKEEEARVMNGAKAKAKDPGKELTD